MKAYNRISSTILRTLLQSPTNSCTASSIRDKLGHSFHLWFSQQDMDENIRSFQERGILQSGKIGSDVLNLTGAVTGFSTKIQDIVGDLNLEDQIFFLTQVTSLEDVDAAVGSVVQEFGGSVPSKNVNLEHSSFSLDYEPKTRNLGKKKLSVPPPGEPMAKKLSHRSSLSSEPSPLNQLVVPRANRKQLASSPNTITLSVHRKTVSPRPTPIRPRVPRKMGAIISGVARKNVSSNTKLNHPLAYPTPAPTAYEQSHVQGPAKSAVQTSQLANVFREKLNEFSDAVCTLV